MIGWVYLNVCMFVFVCIAFVCICACFHVCLYMCGCMHAQTCVFVCVRACVRACVSACTANLLVVGLVMHHRGFILCGVANGSSSGPCHVVERSGCPGVGLPSQQKVPVHTACTSCSTRRTKLLLRTILLSLICLPATRYTRPKSNASNWLISVPSPGVLRGWGASNRTGSERWKKVVCVYVCVYACVCVCACVHAWKHTQVVRALATMRFCWPGHMRRLQYISNYLYVRRNLMRISRSHMYFTNHSKHENRKTW